MDTLLKIRATFRCAILCCLVLSCRDNIDFENTRVVFPLASTVEVNELSSYVSNVELISIKDISLGNISKLIQLDNTIFALSGGVVFRMSADGQNVVKVGNVGRGPGEYLMIKDFSLNLDEDELWCLDVDGKILRFQTADNRYIGQIDFGTDIGYCNAFLPMKDNHVALYIPNPPEKPLQAGLKHDCLRVFDSEGNFLCGSMPWSGFNVVSSFSVPVSYSGNKTYVLSPESSSPYILYVDGEETDSVFLDFEKHNLPLDYAFHYKPDPWSAIGDIFEKDFYKVVSCVYYLDNAKYFHAFGKESSSWNFYISNDGRGIRWRSVGLLAPPVSAVGCSGDYLYFAFSDYGQTELNQEPDPLKKVVLERLGNRAEEGLSYLVKVKFNVQME